jgi:hypothetical protein
LLDDLALIERDVWGNADHRGKLAEAGALAKPRQRGHHRHNGCARRTTS